MTELIETDVLIIGGGIAGATAALQLGENGYKVHVITRSFDPRESATFYAQGGIIYKGKNDSAEKLKNDILRAGAGHCNPPMVDMLAQKGPKLVKDLLIDKLKIQFDRDEKGELTFGAEGRHSVPRILHVADATGESLQESLVKELQKNPNINLLNRHTAVDLLTPAHHSKNRLAVYDQRSCLGAYVLDRDTRVVIRVLSKFTIMATGGLGQIFLRTTNPEGMRGDGIAMAYRAGARVINSEFIQFHPTAFFHDDEAHFLISEAARGAGARLIDFQGKTFMEKYAPEWKDLAPRDVVARGIHQEMLSQGKKNVYIDFHSYINKEDIKSNFPNIFKNCLDFGVDITREPAPVVPAAHYFCGGIWIDEWGKTTIQNLYAIGEVACSGLHGANRLASNSLLEGLLWGHNAATDINRNIKNNTNPIPDLIPPWQDAHFHEPDKALINQDLIHIKHIMWNYVGVVRTTRRLRRALRELRTLETEIENFYRASRVNDSLIGLRNAVRAAIIVTSAAWANRKSMGCHYRED